MDSEKLIEKSFRERIKRAGGIALKFHCLSFSGFPDRIVLMPFGKIYFIELKSEGKKPTKIQNVVHARIRALGFKVWVLSSIAEMNITLNVIMYIHQSAEDDAKRD